MNDRILGDDFPPCELNRIEQGGFYGWPYANGDKVPDFGNGKEEKIDSSIAPVHAFGAHTAPLGITFLRNGNLPRGYRHAALVALHGPGGAIYVSDDHTGTVYRVVYAKTTDS